MWRTGDFYNQMIPLVRGEREGVEIITAGVSRLIRDPDRTSTGSTQSTGNSGGVPSLLLNLFEIFHFTYVL